MPHINQIISSISPRLLQFHTCRPAKMSINVMQHTQNIRAKIIWNKRSRDSTTECFRELHWLPIQQIVDFKILILIFKSLTIQTPKYLQEPIIKKEQRREGLRSNTKHNLLEIPTPKRKPFESRAFSTYRPTTWNQLLDNLCMCVILETFKNH